MAKKIIKKPIKKVSKKLSSKKKDVSIRYESFCQNFVALKFKGTKAAEAAGYSKKSASAISSELLKKPEIQERIHEINSEALRNNEVTIDRIVKEYKGIAFLDPADIFKGDWSLKDLKDIPEHARRAIAGVDITTLLGPGSKTTKLKLWDKIKALDSLGKHKLMFKDEEEQDKSVTIIFNGNMPLPKPKPKEEDPA